MASVSLLIISTFFFLSISLSTCHVDYQTFIRCIHNQSSGHSEILQHIHPPSSPAYKHLLRNATQNPRFNATSEQPFLIVAPHEEIEIRPVIMCSKMLGHQIRAKSGGHDYEGLSFHSKTPFIMIDLSKLKQIIIDLDQETAWIQTGVTLGEFYYEIAKNSKTHAFAGGLYPTVGSGGQISGGGLGTLMRKYGLASDNVLDARIMDVNGIIRDREAMGKDLFWAIRGGGGASFGVILAWKLKLVRVPENVTAFSFRRKLEPGNLNLVQKWQNNAYNFSEDLFIRVLVQNILKNASGNEKFVQVTYNGLFLGPADELVSFFKGSFPEFGLETEDCFKEPGSSNNCSDKPCIKKECYQVPWIKSVLFFFGKKVDQPVEILLQKNVNTIFYKGTSDFLKVPIPDEGWNMIHDTMLADARPIMILDPLGGKMDEIGEEETPFPHRKGNLFNIQYLTYWEVNTDNEAKKHKEWLRSFRKEMEPYVARSPRTAYINYKDLDLGKNDKDCSYSQAKVWGEKYFNGNFERLARVKGMVDPCNFFRNEQSIPVLL